MDKTIKNFGHFWRRDLVNWDQYNGQILGTKKRGSDSPDVNVRNQKGIYVLLDADRRVLYTGQVGKGKTENRTLFPRLREHFRGELSDRWTHFSWFGLLEIDPNTKEPTPNEKKADQNVSHETALKQLEAVLMLISEPPFNRQGPQWAGATMYYQFVEREDVTLESISGEIANLRSEIGSYFEVSKKK